MRQSRLTLLWHLAPNRSYALTCTASSSRQPLSINANKATSMNKPVVLYKTTAHSEIVSAALTIGSLVRATNQYQGELCSALPPLALGFST